MHTLPHTLLACTPAYLHRQLISAQKGILAPLAVGVVAHGKPGERHGAAVALALVSQEVQEQGVALVVQGVVMR